LLRPHFRPIILSRSCNDSLLFHHISSQPANLEKRQKKYCRHAGKVKKSTAFRRRSFYMDMISPLVLNLSEKPGEAKLQEEISHGRFVRVETHIDWLRHDVTEIRNELKDVRVEIKDVRSEIKDVRSEIKDVRSEIKDVRGEIKDVRDEIRDVRKDMRSDFRLMFSALIMVALGLSSIMAKGFHWL